MDDSDSFNPFKPPPSNQNTGRPVATAPHVKPTPQPTVKTDIVDNYEPFNQPAVIEPSSQPPPSSSQNQRNELAALERMQRDLEERERKLIKAEEQQTQYGAAQGNLSSMNNFPPLPSFFPCKPCFYQDIDVDIPEIYRPITKFAFYLWIAYSITLFINMFATMAYMIDTSPKDGGPLFGVSLLLAILFVPMAYIFWFRPLYKAFRTNSSFSFFTFFFVFLGQIIILIIQCLGINVLGSSGWIVSLGAKSMGVRIFMLLVAACFTAVLGLCIFLIIRVNVYFRSSGASYRKAQEEVSQQAASQGTSAFVAAAASSVRKN